MTQVQLKICGMKYNTQEVAALQPDYLGFIFYEKSKRDFGDLEIPELPEGIDRVGVFVDADIAFAKAISASTKTPTRSIPSGNSGISRSPKSRLLFS